MVVTAAIGRRRAGGAMQTPATMSSKSVDSSSLPGGARCAQAAAPAAAAAAPAPAAEDGPIKSDDTTVVHRSGVCVPPGVDRSKVDFAALIKTGSVIGGAVSPAVDSPSPPDQPADDNSTAVKLRLLAGEDARVQAAVHQKRRARRQLAQVLEREQGPREVANQRSGAQLPEPEPEPEPELVLQPEQPEPVYDWNPEELAQQAAVLKHLLVRALLCAPLCVVLLVLLCPQSSLLTRDHSVPCTQEEKERQDLKAAHWQQTLHLDPAADVTAPSAAWSTVDTARGELVLTFLTQGRLGFDLTCRGVSCIANDATPPVSTDLRVGMTLSAVQGTAVSGLSAEEMRRVWSSTAHRRPLALAFVLPVDVDPPAEPEPEPVPEPEPEMEGHDYAARSPTVATQRMVEKTVESLVGLSEALTVQQQRQQQRRQQQQVGTSAGGVAPAVPQRPQTDVDLEEAAAAAAAVAEAATAGAGTSTRCTTVQLDSSAIDTVKASAEALRAAADEIELLKRELSMFQQRSSASTGGSGAAGAAGNTSSGGSEGSHGDGDEI